MKLEKKRALAARTLGVGKGRIVFNSSRLAEVKEAITKQDIKDLHASGAIIINEISGRKRIVKSKSRKRAGSHKLKIKNSKRKYIINTRKLRSHLKHLKSKNLISNDKFIELRKEIRASKLKSLSGLKERLTTTEEKNENPKKKKKRSKN